MRSGRFLAVGGLLCPFTMVVAACDAAPSDASLSAGEPAEVVLEAREISQSSAPKVSCAVTGTRETEGDCAEFAQGLSGLKAGIDAFKPEQPMIRDESTTVRYSLAVLPDIAQGADGWIATPTTHSHAQAPNDPEPLPRPPLPEDGQAWESAKARPTKAQLDEAIETTEKTVTEQVADPDEVGQIETGTIKVAGRMFACLTGDRTFEIGPTECKAFNMIENPYPVWEWQVIPRAGGNGHKLFLRSGIELEGTDGQPRRIGRYAKTETIRVDVSMLGKVQDGLKQAESWARSPLGLIAALTALLLAIGGLIAAWRRARAGQNGAA